MNKKAILSFAKTVTKCSTQPNSAIVNKVVAQLNERQTFEQMPTLNEICDVYASVYLFAREVHPFLEDEQDPKPLDLNNVNQDELTDYIYNHHYEFGASFGTWQLFSILYNYEENHKKTIWHHVFASVTDQDNELRMDLIGSLLHHITESVIQTLEIPAVEKPESKLDPKDVKFIEELAKAKSA